MIMQPKNRQGREIYSNSLVPYFLFSVLIHGLIVLLSLFERSRSLESQSKIEQKPDSSPIEFIIVPPEQKSDRSPPKTKRRAVANSIARGKIKSDKTRQRTGSVPRSPGNTATTPQPTTAIKPKVAEPIKPATSPKKPTSNSVATRSRSVPPLPPKKNEPAPSQPQPVPSPSPSTGTNSGAASLLGGSFKRSIQEDSGSSFFSTQTTANKEAPYATLDAQQDDLAPYFDEIRRRVKRNWQPFSPGQEQYTVIVFSIQRSGQMTGLKVLQTSGNEQVDRDALDAIAQSAPFDALPQSFPRDRLDVQFNFSIYIHQGSFTPNLESNW
jgi:periplasmic protein TonB